MANNILIYFLFAIAPGLIWLFYFLRKDKLPEPKLQILKIFVYGVIATIPAVFIELTLIKDLGLASLEPITYTIIKYIFIIGFIEELFKYIVVRFFILKHSCMDEPIDIPLYMIISALGFATLENILVFSNDSLINIATQGLLIISITRFITATFLHALCSGLIGCFIALSFYALRFRWFLISIGFILAISLHGLFDFYIELGIMGVATENETIYPLFILFILAISVFILLKEIRKIKSVCKI
jgi:RsiW-degrading membrane proteinase PrsW (M82 family)